jgi:hypothetical protein
VTVARIESGAAIPWWPPNSSVRFPITSSVPPTISSIGVSASVATPPGVTDTDEYNNTAQAAIGIDR